MITIITIIIIAIMIIMMIMRAIMMIIIILKIMIIMMITPARAAERGASLLVRRQESPSRLLGEGIQERVRDPRTPVGAGLI